MVKQIETITVDDAAYPPLLRETDMPPERLYVLGAIDMLQHTHLLAVVGSRKANTYGKQCAAVLLPPLVHAGIVLVSGLAYGIDAMAHRVCTNNLLPTIAVLGSGIDEPSIYPRPHVALAKSIIKYGGALVSEYPPGTPAYQSHFPARNRIIAGLCQATLIVQASHRSGSLITARLALESNREVCAVPGPITDPLSAGTNHLIQQGALPATGAQDIIDLFDIKKSVNKDNKTRAALSAAQTHLLDKLTHEPKHVDVLTASLHLPPHAISSMLIELELQGLVHHVGGMRYVLGKQ